MEKDEEKVSSDVKDVLKQIVEEEKAEKPEKTEKPKKERSEGAAKKLKHGTMATVFTCVFLALLVLVNVVTTVLFERYPITIDLTKDKIYSMTEQSEEYVKKVDRDVLVTIFADEDT